MAAVTGMLRAASVAVYRADFRVDSVAVCRADSKVGSAAVCKADFKVDFKVDSAAVTAEAFRAVTPVATADGQPWA